MNDTQMSRDLTDAERRAGFDRIDADTNRPLKPTEVTQAERKAGFVRRDAETGDPLREGWMTAAESRAFWPENRRRWRAVFFAKDPPGPAEEWAWTWSCGWVRRGKAKGGR